MKILILSDTHGYLDDFIKKHCTRADEIWHAGDIGNIELLDSLSAIKPVIAVSGNIDGGELLKKVPHEIFFTRNGLKVFMTHIGGYPGRYSRGIAEKLRTLKPDLFICGHSHILKVMHDPKNNNLLFINPGAAGKQGFHLKRTMVTFDLKDGKISNMDCIELGKK